MPRTQKSRGVRKTRRNPPESDPVPVAKKSFRKTREPESRIADIDLSKNTWTVKEAALWAGIPERTLYRLLRAGVLPCIAMGDTQVQDLATAKNGKRVRRCYRFVIPSRAFQKAWES